MQKRREATDLTDVTKLYIIEHLPQVHSAVAAIQAADTIPLEAREVVLAIHFRVFSAQT